ncbi:MAG TPA: TetR/AcrR family transcriptional regulator [Streptosporangiaceae bacterium]
MADQEPDTMSTGFSGPAIWTRPERRPAGRPPRHSRAEITAAANAIADREGLDAVSMRRVAAGLGTGAASLYRYLDSREDLLDLMSDATGAEYSFRAPAGDWLADLVELGTQARAIMHRHPWLADLVPRRPALGPNGLALLQHFLEVLQPHPASSFAKLEAFGMLFAVTAVFVQAELSGGPASQRRNAAYLQQAISSGEYPRLGELLVGPPAAPVAADRYAELIRRILTGLLGHGT